ncbi:serine/threonine-protein kinase Nek11 [Dicentrarchus labrax]|uniref:non-specific serine/threonine protein kinase n=1 Tax=Dicentrarchus labrax TaxID=13489 RepID=A0A8P4GQV5_DICLA|nr:serine/threonine-protein kinase Nek11 [Dicentrarchus labrax]XP_051255308.1 serine/threonine-protein kinase Nek11 [Dicentrarchus labrax]
MYKFQEVGSGQAPPPGRGSLVAKRYSILQSLGRGSFGSVYLVQDNKATDGEELKVLKQIPLGDLRPDETVRATQEAHLLSQLHHPAILTFYHSFLEGDAFCIVTEFCQDRDLDCKLEEVRQAGRSLPELQVIDWLIQLLLGLHYMHDRRILHRDLKAKNVFLKRNLVKIGDFGVSCLLMGSCDLATTFTGTPYYMSPEVLNHQGYDSKSDIWALGCLLYEMCSLTHAFQGPNFLSVVMKIVEGETPTLPSGYSQELNSVMQRMLQKQPSSRPSAAELLKTKFMEDNMKNMKDRFVFVSSDGKKDAELIAKNMQTKVHLQTLMEKSEVEKMTPRERMRLRKLQAADEKARRLRKLAEEKYEEIHTRRRELRSRHFEKVSLDVLNESREGGDCQSRPISVQDHRLPSGSQPIWEQDEGKTSESGLQDIPEDPQAAEVYYNQDGFDSCSEDEDTETLYLSDPQVSELEAMMKHMQKVLEEDLSGDPAEPEVPLSPRGPPTINGSLLETRIQHLRESVRSRLGSDVFQKLYENLKEARWRWRHDGDDSVTESLRHLEEQPDAGFQVDQLLFYEEELQRVRHLQEGRPPV